VGNPTYHFPNGGKVTVDQMGPVVASFKNSGTYVFGDMLNQQAAWLGVPMVNTVGCGHIETPIPNGFAGLLSILPAAPWLIKYLPQAHRMRMACDFVPGCKVVDASGQIISEISQAEGEAFTTAEVMLADQPAQPQGEQPRPKLSPLLYLTSDTIVPLLSIPTYRRGLRRAWGQDVTPIAVKHRGWLIALCLGILIAFVTGWLLGRRR
jgi:hypothetical protein